MRKKNNMKDTRPRESLCCLVWFLSFRDLIFSVELDFEGATLRLWHDSLLHGYWGEIWHETLQQGGGS